jgi:hypothetical protein
MPLSIEELRYRLKTGRTSEHDRLVRTARERGYRYFQLKNSDAYAIYDAATNEQVSGKKLIPAKEALRLMETLVRHSELHGDNDPDSV